MDWKNEIYTGLATIEHLCFRKLARHRYLELTQFYLEKMNFVICIVQFLFPNQSNNIPRYIFLLLQLFGGGGGGQRPSIFGKFITMTMLKENSNCVTQVLVQLLLVAQIASSCLKELSLVFSKWPSLELLSVSVELI